jgi:hypothetical protein
MKRFTQLLTMRTAMAAALCLGIVLYSPSRIALAGAPLPVAATLKSESQYRSEASRYDAAIRAISVITTMRLDTADDLSKAVAIAERERPNLKLRFSKFVVTGLSDSRFVAALKKKMPNKQAAEAFAKELSADRSALMKLEGAETLKARIVRSAEADAALLKRVGLLLKEAGEKIKKTAQGHEGFRQLPAEEFKVVRAGFAISEEPADSLAPSALEPLSASAAVAIAVVVSILAGFVIGFIEHDVITVQDEEESCLEKADEDYNSCQTAANGLPAGFPLFLRESARAVCIGKYFLDVGACHLLR